MAPFDKTAYHAKGTIYDAVGNVVKQAEFSPINNGFRMVWRGENRNGRIVGQGTYLAFVAVFKGDNHIFFKTLKIGFMR